MIDREYFIYRIASGKLILEDLTIINPSVDLLYEANSIYKKVYEETEAITEQEMIRSMLDIGYITEDELEFKPNEKLKIELYKSLLQPIKARLLREDIKQEEERYEEIYNKKYRYAIYTKEGIATYAKAYHIIKNTTYKGNKRYDWSKYSVDTIMSHSNQSFISEKIIREIARTDPWLEFWSCAQKSSSFLFAQNAMDLTRDQRRLIMWSSLYDNVRNHQDPPNSVILNDDYMFDGWLIDQNDSREEKKDKKKKKYKDGQEIFIKVDNPEDAKAVEEMNSYQSKLIKQSRQNKIMKDGVVFEQNLPDIKTKIKMKMNQGK